MGKRTTATVVPSTEASVPNEARAAAPKAAEIERPAKKLESSRFYIVSSYNNTMITVTDAKGNVLAWSTSGSLGFKGPKKATPFAATSIVETLLQKLRRFDLGKVSIFIRGVGGGREAAVRALITRGLDVQLIKDVTPIPHNGPRPRKPRRV
jgi:small subunit ribosomal protein S11